jgi:hypothetical protein
VADSRATRRRLTNALGRFLLYLEELEHAVVERNPLRITALLRKRTATHLPRSVREELLAISRAPRESLRAPVQFLRFQHRMTQLARGGEGLPTAQTELWSDDAPAPSGVARLYGDAERRAAATEYDLRGPRHAARDQHDDAGGAHS